ncbi:hypothetical protein D3C71_2056190 [compost metagenome]
MSGVFAKRLRLIRRQLRHVDTGIVDDAGLQELRECGALLRFVTAAGDECKGKREGE